MYEETEETERDEYTIINKERNTHLVKLFIPGSEENKTATLKGRNRVYNHYIKVRMNDSFEDPRTYCDIIDENLEETVNKEYYSGTEANFHITPVFPPKFDSATPSNVKF